MLKITITEDVEEATLKLEGKLIGPWIEELARCWKAVVPALESKAVVVDLDAVTFVAEPAKSLLVEMCAQGARLVGRGPLIAHIIADIREECAAGVHRAS